MEFTFKKPKEEKRSYMVVDFSVQVGLPRGQGACFWQFFLGLNNIQYSCTLFLFIYYLVSKPLIKEIKNGKSTSVYKSY